MNTIRAGLMAGAFAGAIWASATASAAEAEPKHAGAPTTFAPGTVFSDCADVCPKMVVIAPGAFRMGADAGEEGRPEGPAHAVTIRKRFALGQLEVSNAQYASFIAATGHVPSTDCRSIDPQKGTIAKMPGADFRHPGLGAGDGAPDMPAACISWSDAQAYAEWLSAKTGAHYRLPTEAEWEYAARAGSSADYSWGASADTGCGEANMLDADGAQSGLTAVFGGQSNDGTKALPHATCHDGHAGAAPVGRFAANAFGLHDMIGNVWEWTQDCYAAPYPADVPTDGSAYINSANCPLRAVRGGSWISTPFRNRVSWRGRDPVDQVTWIFGMRIARDLPEG
ncbi:formylglycine-generating enzyme family protein [Novosphingobium profundi]|uniref:formylglycine-generating enzyme family protein n=1 Tax=Novosphingobium profundi TaxID=1774954 RepID=UPI001BDABA74|nr:formylglycine-generating enzyme family protein [Novosphingobium profundi]MBT0671390.1 formylglycine-generating enzyme family protein [Novosphingobium profundi]